MKVKLVLSAMAWPFVFAGCAAPPCAVESYAPGFEKVSVRFSTPPEAARFAVRFDTEADTLLVSHGSTNIVRDGQVLTDYSDETTSFHAVLWGEQFNGEEVTHESTPLTPGQYMFGLFDEYNGTAYQGWITVNNGGDDYLDLLRDWRDTVHAQKAWLGFDYKLAGKFASTDPTHFSWFGKQVGNIKRLEKRINDAIEAEKRERRRLTEQHGRLFARADVLLVPGMFDFSHPSTRPAIRQEELDRVRDGYPLTKIVTVADYEKSVEKLRRVNDLRKDLERNRTVFEEEIKRLQRRKRFYTVTDHLYKHDKKFVDNERRLQDAFAVIEKIDRQLDDHRKKAYALAFVTGLFAPEVSEELFDREEREFQRDRLVLEEHQNQINQRFDRLADDSARRIAVERDRQMIATAIDDVDRRIEEIAEARIALATLRDSCGVIHREGPARVLTATLVDGALPAYVVDAIERESLMTIRIQSGEERSGTRGSGVAVAPRNMTSYESLND